MFFLSLSIYLNCRKARFRKKSVNNLEVSLLIRIFANEMC
jgi:hypothetical protein